MKALFDRLLRMFAAAALLVLPLASGCEDDGGGGGGDVGDNNRVYSRRSSGQDITSVYAAAGALWTAYEADGGDYDPLDSVL